MPLENTDKNWASFGADKNWASYNSGETSKPIVENKQFPANQEKVIVDDSFAKQFEAYIIQRAQDANKEGLHPHPQGQPHYSAQQAVKRQSTNTTLAPSMLSTLKPLVQATSTAGGGSATTGNGRSGELRFTASGGIPVFTLKWEDGLITVDAPSGGIELALDI